MNERWLGVLRALLDRPSKGWTSKALANETGVSKTTAWRILREYAEKDVLEEKEIGRSKIFNVKRPRYLEKLVGKHDPSSSYLKEVAGRFVELVSGYDEIRRILLYGSVARGSATLDSDIDLFIVLSDKGVEDELYGLASKVNEEEGANLVLDIVTGQEMGKMRRREDPFLQVLEEEGEVLYERTP